MESAVAVEEELRIQDVVTAAFARVNATEALNSRDPPVQELILSWRGTTWTEAPSVVVTSDNGYSAGQVPTMDLTVK